MTEKKKRRHSDHKTEMFTIRLTEEQSRFLEYASQELAAVMGSNTKTISKGFVMLKLMELGKKGFQKWVHKVREDVEAEEQKAS